MIGDGLAELAEWYPRRNSAQPVQAQDSKAVAASDRLLNGTKVNATTGYLPKFNTLRLNEAVDLASERYVLPILGSTLGGLGGAVSLVCLTFANVVDTTNPLLLGIICVPTALGAVAGGLHRVRQRKWFGKLLPVLLTRESLRLRTWLRERYAIEVDDYTANKLSTVVQGRASQPEDAAFHDVQHNVLKLEWRDDAWFVEEDIASKEQEWRPEGTVAALESVVAPAAPAVLDLLSGEARVLHDGVMDLLARLNASAQLPPEQAHICARVREDLAAVLALVRRMHALAEPLPEQEQRVVAILSALMGELRQLVATQQADITRELAVQQDYLIARSMHATGGLRLPPAAIPAITAVRQEQSK